MKFYGDANMLQNQVQHMALQQEDYFPSTPVLGQICFVQKIVYICVQITGGIPIWVPLTREVELYIHSQNPGAAVWNINHDLNTQFVLVQVYDSSNKNIIPNEIEIIDANNVKVTFSNAQIGRAVVLSGSLDGNQKPTYAYEWTQTTPASNWVINHNLGYNPLVRIFIGNSEVQPGAIVHNSINQVTISFATPQTGIARLI